MDKISAAKRVALMATLFAASGAMSLLHAGQYAWDCDNGTGNPISQGGKNSAGQTCICLSTYNCYWS